MPVNETKYDDNYTNPRKMTKWLALKASMVHESDAIFLYSKGGSTRERLLTLEQATELAEQRNKELLDFITK